MATVLWLDDLEWEVRHFCDALQEAGHTVHITESEDEVLRELRGGRLPDVLVQDLGRSVSYLLANDGTLGEFEGFLEDAGWRFYDRFLRKDYPQLPVIICSNLGSNPQSIKRADDFNLAIVQKNNGDTRLLRDAVYDAIVSTSTLLEVPKEPPSFVALDFDRVNGALIRHLNRRPLDVHRLSWASFERLAERLLVELGYEVERTPLTKDGGVDLWALQRSDLGDVLFAIDAKKYRPDRLVGPDIVRAIHGVADLSNASMGMIITASSFSKGARSLEAQFRHRISLKDYQDLVVWLATVAS